MRWILWIVGGLAAFVAVVAFIGWRLPKAHTASVSARVPLSPDAVYTLLSDVSQYQSWRPELKRLERLPDRDGRPAWVEETTSGRLPMFFERTEDGEVYNPIFRFMARFVFGYQGTLNSFMSNLQKRAVGP